jgi:glycosyltransferase involved in cell wall biosynthesis
MIKQDMGVSLIIPTYNRADDLVRALRSLRQQTLKDFEVIVVDNAPDKGLQDAVEDYKYSTPYKVTYVPEPRLGLHHARHAGARLANGDILVFTDDDATFAPGWLKAYWDAFRRNPVMAAAGGPVRPVWETPPPQWLLRLVRMSPRFPILSLMEPYHEFRLDEKGYFFGVNMVIRRNILFELGGFNPELIGNKTVGDGESGLNRKLRERGHLIGYVPDAVVYHHIPEHRMTPDYLRKWAWHLGGAKMYERLQGKKPSLLRLVAEAIRVSAIHWPWWLCSPFVRNCTDRFSFFIQLHGSAGWCQMNYLWWVCTDRQLRDYLIQQDFIR